MNRRLDTHIPIIQNTGGICKKYFLSGLFYGCVRTNSDVFCFFLLSETEDVILFRGNTNEVKGNRVSNK